jgi:hypothetical protein
VCGEEDHVDDDDNSISVGEEEDEHVDDDDDDDHNSTQSYSTVPTIMYLFGQDPFYQDGRIHYRGGQRFFPSSCTDNAIEVVLPGQDDALRKVLVDEVTCKVDDFVSALSAGKEKRISGTCRTCKQPRLEIDYGAAPSWKHGHWCPRCEQPIVNSKSQAKNDSKGMQATLSRYRHNETRADSGKKTRPHREEQRIQVPKPNQIRGGDPSGLQKKVSRTTASKPEAVRGTEPAGPRWDQLGQKEMPHYSPSTVQQDSKKKQIPRSPSKIIKDSRDGEEDHIPRSQPLNKATGNQKWRSTQIRTIAA